MENVYDEMLAWPLNEQAKYVRGFADGEGGPRFYLWRHEKRGHHSPGEPHNRAITITKFAELIGFSDPKKMDVLQQIIASYRQHGS